MINFASTELIFASILLMIFVLKLIFKKQIFWKILIWILSLVIISYPFWFLNEQYLKFTAHLIFEFQKISDRWNLKTISILSIVFSIIIITFMIIFILFMIAYLMKKMKMLFEIWKSKTWFHLVSPLVYGIKISSKRFPLIYFCHYFLLWTFICVMLLMSPYSKSGFLWISITLFQSLCFGTHVYKFYDWWLLYFNCILRETVLIFCFVYLTIYQFLERSSK